jgi:hypothetical protein
MSYGSAFEQFCMYQAEAVANFAIVVDPTWAAGIPFLAVNPQFRTMTRQSIPNENYRRRDLATRPMVRSLATGEVTFGLYLHGRATVVADDARATITSPNFPLAHFMLNAWGGQRLGYRSLVASGSTAAPVVEAGDGAQFRGGDWVFAYDESTDATRGVLRKIESVSVDTLTMWAGHTLPTADANDVLGAVISCYPQAEIMKNPNHASHVTHTLWHQGELAEDVQQAEGTKLNVTGIEGLAAGEPGIIQFSGMVARVDKEGLTAVTPVDPLGDAPLATSTGVDTLVWISAVGAALAQVEWQSITPTPGIMSALIPGGGVNGRWGYTIDHGSVDSTGVDIAVDFDADWSIGFLAGTRYQVLIQVGTIAGEAYGVAMLTCELVEDPNAGPGAGVLLNSMLKFRALESEVSTALTGDALAAVRAKVELLLTCAR